MNPIKILLFLVAVFVLLAGTMLITPSEGVKVGEFNFHMPTFGEMFLPEKIEYADVSEIIEQQFDIDSLSELALEDGNAAGEIDTASYHALVESIHKIEINEEGRENLAGFFQKLKSGQLTRIMHYGDSQLEGDRITAPFRNKLQSKYGGTGLGLRPAVQPYDFVFSAVQTNSDNWVRYPIYGNVDTLIQHSRYGVMGAFSRFAPLTFDSIPFHETEFYEAELSISKSNISYNRTRQYKKMRLYYGNAKSPVTLQLFVSDVLVFSEILKPDIDFGIVGDGF